MKIGIYNPYFDSFGGGERYVLTLAEHWSTRHDVSLFWDDTTIVQKAEERFDLDLSNVTVVPNIFGLRNIVKKLVISRNYDLIVFLSDGSVPTSFARHNILHFQVPFAHVAMPSWKAAQYQRIVCNSEFTKRNLDKTLSIETCVIYPPVDIAKFISGKKTKTILSVGRFSGQYEAKKQEVLLDAFQESVKKHHIAGWKLILAGGLLPSDIAYFESLTKQADGFSIELHPNCSFSELRQFYSTASLYWHAAGFGETNPERMEHFGITTVEAMASGAIPIAFDGGGQSEIIHDGKDGFLWKTKEELIKKTLVAMKSSGTNKRIIREAKLAANHFSKDHFVHEFDTLIAHICHTQL